MMALSLFHKRVSALVACFLASLACGTMYVYSAYSTQLADRLNLSATQSSIIGIAGPIGVAMLGGVGGWIADRFGPTLPCCIGTVLLLLGYSVVYLCYVHTVRNVPLLVMSLMLAGFGSTCTYSAAIKVAAVNFPGHRGTATSIPMSAFGLSAFLFSTVGGIIYPGDTAGFLRTLAIMTSGLSLINTPFIRLYREVGNSKQQEVEQDTETSQEDEQSLIQSQENDETGSYDSLNQEEQDGVDSTELQSKNSVKYHYHELEGESIGGFKLFTMKQYWAHFLLMGLLCGSGQMYIYCVGYVVRALVRNGEGGDLSPAKVQAIQALQVALISCTNCLGRLTSGSLSDFISKRYGLQRMWLLAISLVLIFTGNLLATIVTDAKHLSIVSLCVGTAYGLIFGVYPSVVSTMWGIERFSGNWGTLAISQVVSSYMFSYMFGQIFDANSIHEGDSSVSICLKGSLCYKQTFDITLVINALTMVYLLVIIKHNYKKSLKFRNGIVRGA